MFLYILLALWAVYAVYIVRFVHRQLTSFNKTCARQDPALVAKFDCLCRKDMHKWSHLEMYFCAIFLLPFRMVHFLTTFIMGAFILRICLIGTNGGKNQSAERRTLIKSVLQRLSSNILFSLGYYNINHKKVNISDIDPSYPKTAEYANKTHAPMAVCNHGSFLDPFVLANTELCPGFMAKHAVSTYPMVGNYAKAFQAMFVKRESKDSRDEVLNQIKERIQKVNDHPDSCAPLLIFPEGTTSNGESILSFKKGAFSNLNAVHITGIKYHSKGFNPFYDTIGMGRGFLFTMLQFSNNVTIYDMGVYDPKHLNLKGEEEWAIYAGKVKNVMVKALELRSCEHGITDSLEFCKTFAELENNRSQKKTQ